MEKRLYHILTPVPPEELRNVNCLLVGAISIPQCVLKSQVSVAPGQPGRELAVSVVEREPEAGLEPWAVCCWGDRHLVVGAEGSQGTGKAMSHQRHGSPWESHPLS